MNMMISHQQQQQQASRRRRQRSYLPRILEDDTQHTHQHTGARNKQKGALALALQSRKTSETIQYSKTRSSRTSTANTSYFLQETTETFQEILSAIRKGMQEYNCLRKAFLLYLLCVQLNFIPKTSIRTEVFLNFLRNYPTMVGWIFLATKCNRFLSSSPKTTKLSSDKATGGSSDTVDTVSSCMSQDASIDDHDPNQDLGRCRCHTKTSDTSNTASDDDTVITKSRIDLTNEDVHTQTQAQDLQAQPSKSSSWGFFVTAKSNSAQEIRNNEMNYDNDDDDDDEYSYNMPSTEQTASFEVYPNHTPNNDAEETIINDETRHHNRRPQQAVDSDWGYFADFPEEAPTSPQVEKKQTKFQRSRYYSIYKKYTSMYS